MTIKVIEKNSIQEFLETFGKLASIPITIIPTLEGLIKTKNHLQIHIDQHGQLFVDNDKISWDDREDIICDLKETHLFNYLVKTELNFKIGIEINHPNKILDIEVIIGENDDVVIRKKSVA